MICASVTTIPQVDAELMMIDELDDELLAFDERSTYAAIDVVESVPMSEVYGHVMATIQKAVASPGDAEDFAAEMSGMLKALYIAERHRKRIDRLTK